MGQQPAPLRWVNYKVMNRIFHPRGLLAIALLAVFPALASAQLYEFTTLAGRASIGSSDGVGSDARFSGPEGVAVDANGNVFVADTKNHTIRRIAASGTVTTFAGAATFRGTANGVGVEARFNFPTGLAIDGGGNLFVADRGNHAIRRISPGGVVTTLAGAAGVSGSADGIASGARFSSPSGVALDASGNLFVADTGNRTLRKITPGGIVTTLAGTAGSAGDIDGSGSVARFGGPYGIVVDGSGMIFVTDTWSFGSSRAPGVDYTVRQVTPTGVVTTIAAARSFSFGYNNFGTPRGIVADRAGNVIFADAGFHIIWKIAAGGALTRMAGGIDSIPVGDSGDGVGSAARFAAPSGLAMDPGGNIFVADSQNNAIRRLTPAGAVTTVAGAADGRGLSDGTGASARFNQPNSVAADSRGNVFVADIQNNAIRKITAAGVVTTIGSAAGAAGSADGAATVARFSSPRGVATDATGNVYVADTGNSTIRKISTDGVVTTVAGGDVAAAGGSRGLSDGIGRAARFDSPQALTVGPDGTIFVADSGNNRIRKIAPDGTVTTVYNALATVLSFSIPSGIAVDRAGNMFIVDQNSGVTKISVAGVLTHLSNFVTGGFPDGTGGVAVDDAGNVYVTGRFYHAIRRIGPGGQVTAVAGNELGNGADYGSSDGLGFAAQFNSPIGIAVDAGGNLLVADTANQTIRKGLLATNPARLVNSAVLTALAGVDDSVTLGVITGGAGTSGAKPLLLRAVGPSLAPFGVTSLLTDPKLEFYGGPTKLGENDDWRGTAELSTAFQIVGAFPLASPNSKDAALALPAVAFGGSTVRVTGNGAAGGTVLAELYDATPTSAWTPTMPRLTNVSVLRNVSSDLTVGFIIGGVGAKTLMIRAVGSSLGLFGITDYMDDPKLELFDGKSRSIAANDNWSEGGQAAALSLYAAFPQVGAFRLLGGSLDATTMVTLTPGNYTIQVKTAGIGRPTGVVLVEVYEVP